MVKSATISRRLQEDGTQFIASARKQPGLIRVDYPSARLQPVEGADHKRYREREQLAAMHLSGQHAGEKQCERDEDVARPQSKRGSLRILFPESRKRRRHRTVDEQP